MKVLVCGGRDFTNSDFVWSCLSKAHAKRPFSLVISGGAPGADTLAEQWADANVVHCAVVKAIWRPHGVMDRGAGPKRNRAMLLLLPDAVIAFPGGKGTADMVSAALQAGVTKIWKPAP